MTLMIMVIMNKYGQFNYTYTHSPSAISLGSAHELFTISYRPSPCFWSLELPRLNEITAKSTSSSCAA